MPQPRQSPPRRRARTPHNIPTPSIPPIYLSPDFSAPATAAKLVQQRPAPRQETLNQLRQLRDALALSLHASAPSWHTLAPATASLSEALSATQGASKLRNNLTALHDAPSSLDYPSRMSAVLARTSQLAANAALMSSVREFAELLRLVEASDPITTAPTSPVHTISSPQSASGNWPASSPILPPPSPTASPTSTDHFARLHPHFLVRAAALQKARAAASTPALQAIPALDAPRTALEARYTALLSDLEAVMLDGVFAPTLGHTSAPRRRPPASSNPPPASVPNLSTTPSDPYTDSSKHPSASPLARGGLQPDLARAIDVLCGPGKAAKVLMDATDTRLLSLLRDAVVAECPPAQRTVASLASSSFTAGGPTTASLSVPSVASSTSRATAQVFGRDLPHGGRLACLAVVERVRFQMTAVLRRLSLLADSISADVPHICEAICFVWSHMERLLLLLIQALLGISGAGAVYSGTEDTHTGISLLPSSRKVAATGDAHRYTWELEQGASRDSFTTLVNSMPNLSPSIYNLEIIYNPLQQFILNSNRLLHSWREKTGDECEQRADESTLPGLLERAVQLFLCNVRRDVKGYMDNAFGNRAGTLLQPPSDATRGLAVETHLLPPLPQTQMLLDIIACCLSLCVAVPSVARPLGELINDEVIKPFSERAIYALNLAESWTDAGALVSAMRERAEKEGASCNADILNTIRGKPDLACSCLSELHNVNDPNYEQANLLDEHEWKAVVRLVTNATIVITELEACLLKHDEIVSFMDGGRTREFNLRSVLHERGLTGAGNAAVLEAIAQTRAGCKTLRDEVIERGVILLHAEVVLRCFSEAVCTLGSDWKAVGKKTEPRDADGTSSISEDAANGNKVATPSTIFKVSSIQLSDVDKLSEDMNVICEYDEFGDRIGGAGDGALDADLEEYGYANSILMEEADWNETSGKFVPDVVPGSGQALSEGDRAVIDAARRFGESIFRVDMCVKHNLSVSQRDYVFGQADKAVGCGIRAAGNMDGLDVREVASTARLFIDVAAYAAADSFGWPGVEAHYSVAEGASCAAEECRVLLFAAGML